MRVAIGSLVQETNTFVPFRTTTATFEAIYLRRGEEMLHAYGHARTEIPAFIDVLRAAGADIAPLLGTHAAASGPIERARLRGAGRRDGASGYAMPVPVDAVLLSLHGALVVEDEPDGDAEIVARVRAILPAGTPIGVSLDLHGHITPAMLQPDVFYIGYREYPHIDLYETGERVAHLLLDVLARQAPPGDGDGEAATAGKPGARAHRHRRRSIASSPRRAGWRRRGASCTRAIFPVQPWMDIPDLGFATLACADGDTAAAQACGGPARRSRAWAARDEFEPELTPLDEAIRIGLAGEGLTVVGDVGDAPSGGTAADHTGVLEALLAAGAERAGRLTYLTLCDAAAAREAAAAGPGATVTLAVGHKRSHDGVPLTVTGTVRAITDGRFVMGDAGAQGTEMAFGLTAVLAIGDLRHRDPLAAGI